MVGCAFDGDLGTYWAPYDAAGNVAIIDMGATERVTLTTFDVLQLSACPLVTAIKIETSDDGTTYVDHGTFSTSPLSLPLLTPQQSRCSFPGATARYWRLTFGNTYPRIVEVRGYRLFPGDHALFSDVHADVDLSTAPANGDALV